MTAYPSGPFTSALPAAVVCFLIFVECAVIQRRLVSRRLVRRAPCRLITGKVNHIIRRIRYPVGLDITDRVR